MSSAADLTREILTYKKKSRVRIIYRPNRFWEASISDTFLVQKKYWFYWKTVRVTKTQYEAEDFAVAVLKGNHVRDCKLIAEYE